MDENSCQKVAGLIEELRRAYAVLNAETPPSQADGLIRWVVTTLPNKTRIEVGLEKNHRRPHFHAKCGDKCDVSVDIQTVEILKGQCARGHWKSVRDWAFYKKDLLLGVWNELNETQGVAFKL
jgi:hypothetical protein